MNPVAKSIVRFFCMLTALPVLAGEVSTPPADFAETFLKLSALVDQEELSPLDMAQGTYLAAKYFAVGKSGLPYTQSRFLNAASRGQAAMGGLYMAVHGTAEQVGRIRKDLETNRTKRRWLYDVVGTEDNFRFALQNGDQWQMLTRVLPSTAGSKLLANVCMDSPDALVRRTGMFWGFWIEPQNYWNRVRDASRNDTDKLTRRIAMHLLAAGSAHAK